MRRIFFLIVFIIAIQTCSKTQNLDSNLKGSWLFFPDQPNEFVMVIVDDTSGYYFGYQSIERHFKIGIVDQDKISIKPIQKQNKLSSNKEKTGYQIVKDIDTSTIIYNYRIAEKKIHFTPINSNQTFSGEFCEQGICKPEKEIYRKYTIPFVDISLPHLNSNFQLSEIDDQSEVILFIGKPNQKFRMYGNEIRISNRDKIISPDMVAFEIEKEYMRLAKKNKQITLFCDSKIKIQSIKEILEQLHTGDNSKISFAAYKSDSDYDIIKFNSKFEINKDSDLNLSFQDWINAN